jgi:hypothetical protein
MLPGDKLMATLGSMALTAGDVGFFTPRPPRAPRRRSMRNPLDRLGRLVDAVRREIDAAGAGSTFEGSTPRLRNYPY